MAVTVESGAGAPATDRFGCLRLLRAREAGVFFALLRDVRVPVVRDRRLPDVAQSVQRRPADLAARASCPSA